MIKVGIIGAGISGLSAAYFLHKSGITDIEILEQSGKVGGRVTSFQEIFTKDTIDNGKHLISGAYSTFLELLDFLGNKDKLKYSKNFSIPLISKDCTYKFSLGNQSKFKQLQQLMKIGQHNLSEKVNLIRFLLSIQSKNSFISRLLNKSMSDIENLTVEQFLHSNKQNAEIINYFWEPLTLATINAPIRTAPASLLVNVLRKAFFADTESQKLYSSELPLLELINVEKQLQKIAKIKTETKVEKINITEEGFNVITNRGVSILDAVIIAIPPIFLKKLTEKSKIEELFNPNDYEAIKNYNYSTIMSMYFWTDCNFMDNDLSAMIGTKFQWIFRETENRYTLTMSSANEFAELPKQFLYNLAFAEIEMLFPKFDRSKVTHKLLLTDRFATTEFTTRTTRIKQRILKGLYVAGDWTDTGLPSTIESAALSGKLATKELVKDFS